MAVSAAMTGGDWTASSPSLQGRIAAVAIRDDARPHRHLYLTVIRGGTPCQTHRDSRLTLIAVPWSGNPYL
jgi:hypothetical protein